MRNSKYTDAHLQQVHEVLRNRMMLYAFNHLTHIESRTAVALRSLELLEEGANPEEVSEELLAIISSPDHKRRVKTPPGPLVFYKEEESDLRSVVQMEFFFLNSDPRVRRAAIRHFESLKDLPIAILSPRTLQAIAQSSVDIDSSDPATWTKSALLSFDAVSDDFLVWLGGSPK
jgi:hypothetical protein